MPFAVIAVFAACQVKAAFIFLKMPVLTPKTGVSKNKCVEGAVSANTTPSFLRGYAVDKSRETFHFQIAFVLSVRADGDGVPRDFF